MLHHFATSGSTGTPKRFTLTDAQLAARVASRSGAKGADFAQLRSLYCGLSLKSTAGLTYQMWAQQHGVQFFSYQNPRVGLAPEGYVGDIAHLLELAPKLLPHRIGFTLVKAGVTPAITGEIIAAVDGPIIVSYGASEVASIATATLTEAISILGCVGRLCPGVQVSFDPSGQVLVKTTTMISGYNDPILTREFFRDGWFCTGDLGHWDGELLVLDGRMKGMG